MKLFKRVFRRSEQFGDSPPVVNEPCTEPEVNKWVLSEFVMQTLVPVVGIHPFPLDEQLLMVSSLVMFKPTHIFDWGTNIGKSARIFYEATKAFSLDASIHSIDLPDDLEHEEHPRNKRGFLVQGLEGVSLHQGDGVETSLRLYCENKQAHSKPLFLLDGDHSYESVKRELTEIANCVPEAVVLVHDTFYQSEASGYNIGPFKAIEEFLENSAVDYNRISTSLGLPGMTLLYRK